MKSIGTIEASRRKAARVAGFAFLFAIAIVIAANYGVSFRFVVSGDAVETARNIVAHDTLFRINTACNLVYAATLLVLLSALYVVLEPVGRTLALVAASFRLALALMWSITALNTLSALRLLGDTAYLPVFGTDQLKTLAMLHLASSYDAYYVGLPFWGLASTVCSVLWFRSRLIPRPLAAFGVLSSAWCVFCAFAFLAFPHFEKTVGASWFDVPLVLFEMALGFWLLFKGLRSPAAAATVEGS
jgi:hypothetical protein